jgi:hypothetical protein
MRQSRLLVASSPNDELIDRLLELRPREVARIQRLFEAVQGRGASDAVMLTGEPGAGKSMLATAVVPRLAREAGLDVWVASHPGVQRAGFSLVHDFLDRQPLPRTASAKITRFEGDVRERAPIVLCVDRVDDLDAGSQEALVALLHVLRRSPAAVGVVMASDSGVPGTINAGLPPTDRLFEVVELARLDDGQVSRMLARASRRLETLGIDKQTTTARIRGCARTLFQIRDELLSEHDDTTIKEAVERALDAREETVAQGLLTRMVRPEDSALVSAVCILGARGGDAALLARMTDLAIEVVEAGVHHLPRIIEPLDGEGTPTRYVATPEAASVAQRLLGSHVRHWHDRAAAALRDDDPVHAAEHLLLLERGLPSWAPAVLMGAAEQAPLDRAERFLLRARDEAPDDGSEWEVVRRLAKLRIGVRDGQGAVQILESVVDRLADDQRVECELQIVEALEVQGRNAEALRRLMVLAMGHGDSRHARRIAIRLSAHHDEAGRAFAHAYFERNGVRTPGDHVAMAQLELVGGSARTAVDRVQAALDAGAAEPRPGLSGLKLLSPVWMLICAEAYPQAQTRLGQMREGLEEHHADHLPLADAYLSLIRLADGRVQDATRLMANLTAIENPAVRQWVAAAYMEANLAAGRTIAAHTRFPAIKGADNPGGRRLALAAARGAIARSETAPALTTLERVGRAYDSTGTTRPVWRPGIQWAALLAQEQLMVGRLEVACERASWNLEHARRWGAPRALTQAVRTMIAVRRGMGAGGDDAEERSLYAEAMDALTAGNAIDSLEGMHLRLQYGSRDERAAALAKAIDKGARALVVDYCWRRGRHRALSSRVFRKSDAALTPAVRRVALRVARNMSIDEIAALPGMGPAAKIAQYRNDAQRLRLVSGHKLAEYDDALARALDHSETRAVLLKRDC